MQSLIPRTRQSRLGLGLLLTLALALCASSSALALPTKPYFEGGVSETHPVSFTLTGSGSLSLETGFSSTVCTKLVGSGTLTGPKTGTATLTASGCGMEIGYCHGKGMGINEFKTVELEVIPVYAPKAPEVGFELKPKKGTIFSEMVSPVGTLCEIVGSIVAKWTGSSNVGKTWPLAFSGSKGTQTPSTYENDAHESVNSWLERRDNSSYFKESWYDNLTMTTSTELKLVH
jgi:hypothetical protein